MYNMRMSKKTIPDDYKTAFVNRLQMLRIASGLTQKDVANALSIDKDTYAKYESRSLMPHHLLLLTCDILHCTPESLIGRPQITKGKAANHGQKAV